MVNWLGILQQVTTLAAAVLAIGGWLTRTLRKDIYDMRRQLVHQQASLRLYAHIISRILPALEVKQGYSLNIEEIQDDLGRIISDAFAREEILGNPLSPGELSLLGSYRMKSAQPKPMEPDDLIQLYEMAMRMYHAHPEEDTFSTLYLTLQILTAMLSHPYHRVPSDA